MRTIEDYLEPSKTMKKSTLKIAIFIHFHIFCYVIRVGKFFHCVAVSQTKAADCYSCTHLTLIVQQPINDTVSRETQP